MDDFMASFRKFKPTTSREILKKIEE